VIEFIVIYWHFSIAIFALFTWSNVEKLIMKLQLIESNRMENRIEYWIGTQESILKSLPIPSTSSMWSLGYPGERDSVMLQDMQERETRWELRESSLWLTLFDPSAETHCSTQGRKLARAKLPPRSILLPPKSQEEGQKMPPTISSWPPNDNLVCAAILPLIPLDYSRWGQ